MPGAAGISALSAQRTPRRLLVRGVNWLGDAVMTTPALRRLRERFPETHIALLTPAKLAALWKGHPAINAVLSPAPDEGTWSLARRLRRETFDTGLILPNSPRSALELWLAAVPRRVGYARRWRNWWLTEAVPARPGRVAMRKRSAGEVRQLVLAGPAAASAHSPGLGPQAHQVHEYLHLAGVLGANPEPVPTCLAVEEHEVNAAREKFGLNRLPGGVRLVLGLNPGAEYGPAKRWPVERFVAAAAQLVRLRQCAWLIFGGPAERELGQRLAASLQQSLPQPAAAVPPKNLAGETSLRELMALLKCCRVLLTNDTGPMHVAAALGTPVVALFGSTAPELTGPALGMGVAHRLLHWPAPCAPCFRRACPIDFRCMTQLTCNEAVAAVLELLG